MDESNKQKILDIISKSKLHFNIEKCNEISFKIMQLIQENNCSLMEKRYILSDVEAFYSTVETVEFIKLLK